MDIAAVDKAFNEVIGKWGVYRQLKISRGHVRTLRAQLKAGKGVSLQKKIRILQQYGWRMDATQYTHADMVSLAQFIIRTSETARQFGAEYCVEKWMAQK